MAPEPVHRVPVHVVAATAGARCACSKRTAARVPAGAATTGWWRPRACIAALWLLLLFPLFADAGDDVDLAAAGKDLDVALVTFGPGEEVWERFGHNAILIDLHAPGVHVRRLYNYGMFDFNQQNFWLNFARGRMLYRISVSDPADDYPMYRAEGRWIVQQDLNFTPAQRAKLFDYLEWNARPENAQYRYEYFTANCSTRVRDALDAALGGVIKAQTIAPSRGFTYRMDADRLMRPEPVLMLGMDAGLGPFADQRLSYWDEGFVPMEFMRRLREVRVAAEDGATQPLVTQEQLIAAARLPEPSDFPPDWLWPALALGVAAALLLLALAHARRHTVARALFASVAGLITLACGLGGVLLVVLWTLTEHISAWRNENLLLLDPLCLLLVPAWLGSLRRGWRPTRFARCIAYAVAALAVLAFFIKVFPAFAQDNRMWIALLLPVHVALAFVLRGASGVR